MDTCDFKLILSEILSMSTDWVNAFRLLLLIMNLRNYMKLLEETGDQMMHLIEFSIEISPELHSFLSQRITILMLLD